MFSFFLFSYHDGNEGRNVFLSLIRRKIDSGILAVFKKKKWLLNETEMAKGTQPVLGFMCFYKNKQAVIFFFFQGQLSS